MTVKCHIIMFSSRILNSARRLVLIMLTPVRVETTSRLHFCYALEHLTLAAPKHNCSLPEQRGRRTFRAPVVGLHRPHSMARSQLFLFLLVVATFASLASQVRGQEEEVYGIPAFGYAKLRPQFDKPAKTYVRLDLLSHQ